MKIEDSFIHQCFVQVAAKLEGGGSKRPLEEGPEPNAKKLASVEVPYQQPQPQMR